jgi:hypothetical protein
MKIKKLVGLFTLVFALVFSTTLQGQTLNQQQKRQPVDIEVSDQELTNFVQASQELQMMQYQMQSKIMQSVKQSSMSMERFKEINKKQQQGQPPQLNDEEKKIMTSIQEQYKKEQQALKPKMDSVLKKYSLTQKRFMQISRAMRTDKDLQNRFKEIQKQRQQPK